MFDAYRKILSIPGALKFSVAGLFARFPMSMTGISIVLMVSTLYGNYTLAGQLSGTSVIAFAIAAPFLSRAVDTWGQSKIMRPALSICASATIALAVLAWLHYPVWLLFLCTAIAGATAGSLGAMVRSRWAQVVENPGQMNTAFALEATFDEVVFMLGPVLATLLTTSIHPTAGLASTVLFMLVGGFWFLSQRNTEPAPSKREPGRRVTSVMRSGTMISLFATNVMVGIMFGANDVAAVAFADEHGWKAAAGIMLAAYAAGSMISGILYGARSWKLGPIRLYAVGIFLLAVGNTLFLFAHSILGLSIIMAITGFTISPTMVNINNLVQRIAPAGRLTESLTWLSTAMNLGVSAGSAVVGVIIDHSNARGGFALVVAAAWAMVLVMGTTLPLLRRSLIKARQQSASFE